METTTKELLVLAFGVVLGCIIFTGVVLAITYPIDSQISEDIDNHNVDMERYERGYLNSMSAVMHGDTYYYNGVCEEIKLKQSLGYNVTVWNYTKYNKSDFNV